MSNNPLAVSSRSHFRLWLTATVCFFLFLYLIKGILLPFVVGMLAAYFLDPLMRTLRARGWSRSGAAALITTLFSLSVVLACSLLVPLILQQLSTLANELPGYLHALQEKYAADIDHYISMFTSDKSESFKNAAASAGGNVANALGKIIPGMLQSGLAVLNVLSLVFLTPVVIFYLLRDWEQFVKRIDDMLPLEHATTIREQLKAIDATLSGFIRGQTNVCLIMATYYGVALSLAGLNFGLGMGILTGFLLFIPFVGYLFSLMVCIAIALFQFGMDVHFVMVACVYAVGVVMETGVITPKLVGSKVGLHPIWIIFGMLAGAALFGFVGILISLPVTAVIGVLVRFAMKQYLGSSLYRGEQSKSGQS
jgi:predicted PurR-regulated permease PerM